ncbi:CehA/McbA family metallohydrolase [Luteimonas aquatica]|uniref:CehA/McbA family metallohydrolase n=1 Tax=Luteimonas aquatica TaxID=450364 RepID=UPI001F59E485|nr:CehA/McbA family metallohydrolase [Luteimonas aquatica]
MDLAARIFSCLLALTVALAAGGASAQARAAPEDRAPDLVLRGAMSGADHQRYRLLPFQVPAGTARITVQFEYGGREEKTTIDLGLLGPDGFRGQDGFRGWSGGNKAEFTVSATDATPSYAPGPIRAGTWSLLLGIPNIRKDAGADYTARIWFGGERDPYWQPSVANPPLREEAAWYRGDLHMHDAHSDGSCRSQGGRKVPCPLFLTAQAAAARGLDFVAVTDHNTTSQANAIRELQPYFDRLLLVPGREITTFSGHANLIGPVAPLDFRVVEGGRDWNALLREAAALRGVVSINHPVRPSGEICMGCGWTARPQADPALLQAVEVVNGMDADTPYSGIPFWESLLNAGHRLTAIGGSDNHDAGQRQAGAGGGPVGMPTTVVRASALSIPALLEGLRAGHAFVDVQGSRDRRLEVDARSGTARAGMGDALAVAPGATADFVVRVGNAAGGRVEVVRDGVVIAPIDAPGIEGAEQELRFSWRGDGKPHWLRVDVRGGDGKLWLLGNPVYLEVGR